MLSINQVAMWFFGKIRRFVGSYKPPQKIYLYTHHKIGTALLSKVFRDVSRYYGLRFHDALGFTESVPEDSDIVHFWHSQCSEKILSSQHLGIHLTRDPRDVIVSGYLYHQRTKEEWCKNEDFEIKQNIGYPQVDYSQIHLQHEEKIGYLELLNGKSYQKNISLLNQDDGLIFEMDGFAGRTIGDLSKWVGNETILEMKFEKIIEQYDNSWKDIFSHLGFSGKQLIRACRIAKAHDMNKMSEKEIAKDKHISTGKLRKWKDYFSEEVYQAYTERFENIHLKLDYE